MRPVCFPIFLLLCFCAMGSLALGAEPASSRVDFNKDIWPILSNRCFQCHGPDEAERQGGTDGLRLDTEAGAFEDLGGYTVIVKGKPDESELIRRVESTDLGEAMPPADSGKKRLNVKEIELFRRWIKEGANYAAHWSYVKPERPPLPKVEQSDWPRNEIDHFILSRLEREGLKPSPRADRYSLIRRLSLDLTGLPPTLAEVEEFVNDKRPNAYELLVDRFLAKESYGEHWARMWLDLARYADSAGYADDPPRTIWAYRDYVIRSLNANKPFDQFTIEQIAGDLLPNPSEDQLIATGFHRNTLTNNEGGTNDEEFRNVAIVDRVNTTMAVWMGTTIACAQCHSHKYDPITQEEYFQFFALFNNTLDADRRDESPLLEIYTDEQLKQKAAWETEIARLEEWLKTSSPEGEPAIAEPKKLALLKRKLAEQKPATTVPIMRELAEDKGRVTKIQQRGNYLITGKEVGPGVPRVFHPLPEELPKNRLALAHWLVDEENPLTARVLANRYCEKIFGIGLVQTSEEFGSQGEQPSHPELLDWLATELVRSDWDLKGFVKLLVTSAAYRQSAAVTPELLEQDPDNRLYARGPRFRMSAEMIRDQALFVSGLLSEKMYGPPAKPPQPNMGIKAAFGSGIDWKTSEGSDKYRRGLYTMWRRSNPYPSMATFDAPNREVCTLRRDRTNTPLQALVTLNDPVYVEAAQALGRRIAKAEGDLREKILFGFQVCLARPPGPEETERLEKLYQAALKRYESAPELAKKMATEPLGELPKDADAAEYAAWTVVGNVLLNLDEMFMRR